MKRLFLTFSFILTVLIGRSADTGEVVPESRWGTANLWSAIPTVEQLQHAIQCGFPWYEADISGIGPNETSMRQLKANCDAAGMTIWSAHLPYGGSSDISVTDETERQRVIEKMKTCIKNAHAIDITRLVLHASYEPISDTDRPARIANAKAAIAELQAMADGLGITIMVEDLPRTCLGNTPEELLTLIEGTNALICFDTNHYALGSTSHFMDVAGHKIGTVHFSDFDFEGETHWLPGQGRIAWGELMCRLDEAGYTGVFMSETLKDRANNNAKITIDQLRDSYTNIFAEYEKLKADPAERLRAKAADIKAYYFPEGDYNIAFPAGTDPAFYQEQAVKQFATLYDKAIQASSDDPCDQLRGELYEALNQLLAAANPVEEGYYWIRTASHYFLDKSNEVAMYSDNTGQLKWKAFEESLNFLFKVEKKGDGFTFRNLYDDTYIGANAANSQPVPMTETAEYLQQVVPFGTYGNVKIFNNLNATPYHTISHGGGNGTGSNIVQYNGVVRSNSAWYLRRADEAKVKELLDAKVPLFVEAVRSVAEDAANYQDVVFGYPAAHVDAVKKAYQEYIANPKDETALESLRATWQSTLAATIQPEEGMVYQLRNYLHNTWLCSSPNNYGTGSCVTSPDDSGTLWTLLKEGEGWKLKNLQRDACLGRISKTSEAILFAPTDEGVFEITPSGNGQSTALIHNTNTINAWPGDAYVYTQKYNLLAWKGNDGARWYMVQVDKDKLPALTESLYADLANRLCNAPLEDGAPGTYPAEDMEVLRQAHKAYTQEATATNKAAMVTACRQLTTTAKRIGFAENTWYRLVNANRRIEEKAQALTIGLNGKSYVAQIAGLTENTGEIPAADMMWQFRPSTLSGQVTLMSANGLYLEGSLSGQLVTATTKKADAAPYRMAFNEQGNWLIRHDNNAPIHATTTGTVIGYNDAYSCWNIEPVTHIAIHIDENRYASRCFPFSVELPDGLTAYTASRRSANQVVLTAIDSRVIPARTPIVLFSENETVATYTCPILYTDTDSPLTDNELQGTYAIQPAPFPAYVLSAENGKTYFARLQADADMPANSAYMEWIEGDDTEQLEIVPDTPTGIKDPTTSQSPATLYHLDGTRCTSPVRGRIYVTSDGKKIIFTP